MHKTTGYALRKLRRGADLTQTQAGEAIGVQAAAIGKYENSTVSPTQDVVDALLETYGATLDDFARAREAQVTTVLGERS